MTVAEVAEVLKLNPQTVRNWMDAGKLPALHVGRSVRIKRSDFDRLVEGVDIAGSATREAGRVASVWDGEIPPPILPRTPASGPLTPGGSNQAGNC